jgi:hypothetical protein
MKKSQITRLLPLVVGSAAAGVLALMSPAKAVVLTTVGGTSYNVTTITGTYNANQSAIEGTPWWGNATLAENLASLYEPCFSLRTPVRLYLKTGRRRREAERRRREAERRRRR